MRVSDPDEVEASCIAQSPEELVTRAVLKIWRVAYHMDSYEPLNAGRNPRRDQSECFPPRTPLKSDFFQAIGSSDFIEKSGSVEILSFRHVLVWNDWSLTTVYRAEGMAPCPLYRTFFSICLKYRVCEQKNSPKIPTWCLTLREVVGYVGWKTADVDRDKLTLNALTPISWKSFGDEIEIQVSNEGGSTVVTVSSEPRFSLMNWGKTSQTREFS